MIYIFNKKSLHFNVLIKTGYRFFLSIFFLLPMVAWADDMPVMEVKTDRTMISPQRMELKGEESLMDVLQMVPDLMIAGYEDLISGYNLRIDNCPMNGDVRLILSQMKARDIAKIQVCDNTGVAKGTIGMGKVLDINMRNYDDGASGFVEGEGELLGHGTKFLSQGTGTANILYGCPNMNLYANASYRYQAGNKEYLTLRMTNRLGERDKLLTYFTQQYVVGNEKYMGRARYFHTFNDIGTELLLVGGYQYTKDATTESRLPLGIVELNTPLFTKNLSMMLGWEGDFAMNDSRQDDRNYHAFNNDIYLQFTYAMNQWKFTVGNRVMLYDYQLKMDGKEAHHNDTRNNSNACVIFMPELHHQILLGYYRKYYNPAYASLFQQQPTMNDEEWAVTRGQLVERNINEVKGSYTYSRKQLSVKAEGSYYTVENGKDFGTLGASAFWSQQMLTVAGGVNYYATGSGNYASIRLAPSLYLTKQWTVGVQTVYYTKNSPKRDNIGNAVYACLGISRTWGKHWHVGLDCYNGDNGAIVAKARAIF